jgi:hypothetical protein
MKRTWRLAMLLPAAFLLFAAGCDFFLSNSVPGFLPYVVSELDLADTLPSGVREVVFEVVPAGPEGDQPIFVLVVRPDSPGADIAVIFDRTGTTVRARQESTAITRFDTVPFRRLGGMVQVGNLVYNPETRQLTNGPRLDGDPRPVLTNEDGSDYALVSMATADPPVLELELYDAAFTAPTGTDPIDLTSDVSPAVPGPVVGVNARMLDDTRVEVFLHGEDGALTYLPLEISVGLGNTLPLSSRAELATIQRTAAGFLARDPSGDLLRMDLETGRVRDTFDLTGNAGNNGTLEVVFDPGGSFYLVLDREKRLLYKVAPWW